MLAVRGGEKDKWQIEGGCKGQVTDRGGCKRDTEMRMYIVPVMWMRLRGRVDEKVPVAQSTARCM